MVSLPKCSTKNFDDKPFGRVSAKDIFTVDLEIKFYIFINLREVAINCIPSILLDSAPDDAVQVLCLGFRSAAILCVFAKLPVIQA